LVVCACIFFLVYSYVACSTSTFRYPDDRVNYFFANLYSQTGELTYSEDLNEVAYGTIHPEGTVYIDGKVVSSKFLGFPVISGTAGILSPEIIRFLTPLLAIIGAIFLYLLLRDLFSKKIALLSFCLLFILPPYWFWGTLTMMENVASCVMLIISVRYFFKLINTNKLSHYILAPLFFGLALFMRPDYIFIAIPLFMVLLWNIKKLKKIYVILSVFSFLVAVGPFFILNNALYGSPLSTGIHASANITEGIWAPSFSVSNLFENSVNLVDLTPLLFLCGFIGILYCAKRRIQLHYIAFSVLCTIIIALYYLGGVVSYTTIRSSYVRYFLPISVLFLPFATYFILSFKRKIFSIMLIFGIIVTSALIVVPEVNTNLEVNESYAIRGSEIVDATEPEAVIFLDYWDGVAIFPERRVGQWRQLPEDGRAEALCEILAELSERGVPVYVLMNRQFIENIDTETFVEELSVMGYTLSESGYENLYRVSLTEVSH
jgi:hypothetical protein